MSYLRYGITIICLIIFIDDPSLVLAQSIYTFKGKKTNTSHGMEQRNRSNSSYFSNDSSWFSPDYSTPKETFSNGKNPAAKKIKNSNLNKNRKIRFRGLSGTYTSYTQEYSSSTSSIIWYRLGIGQSVFKYKTNNSGNLYDLENTLIDISYTFGDDYTLTIGGRSVTSGKLTITTSDSGIFNSSDVDGSGYFSTLGIEIGIFEILAGFQYGSYAFTGIENKSTSSYVPKYQGSKMIYVTGIGLAF